MMQMSFPREITDNLKPRFVMLRLKRSFKSRYEKPFAFMVIQKSLT